MTSTSYLAFIGGAEKLWSGISNNGKLIIQEVLKRGNDTPLRVQDIITMHSIASQATMHKELTVLIKGGYLASKVDPLDGRVKIIHLSPKGIALINRLNNLLNSSALKSSR